jgi:hypothetical protein
MLGCLPGSEKVRKTCHFVSKSAGAVFVAGRPLRQRILGQRDAFWPAMCQIYAMTKLLEQALRQIEHLTEAEQDAAAGALLDYVKHMRDARLTEAQIAEIRDRRSDPGRKLVSHAEARERITRLGS